MLQLSEGTVFRVECDDGVTGLILLGRGVMTFSPTAAAERGQLRLFSGNDTLSSPFESAFVRLSPSDYSQACGCQRRSLTAAAACPTVATALKRVFAQNATKSFNVDLQDLSPDDWYLLPPAGDFLAEVETRRFDALTYTLIGGAGRRHQRVSPKGSPDARALSVGRQARRARPLLQRRRAARLRRPGLQRRGRHRSRAQHAEGRARLLIRVRSTSVSTMRLRLGEALAVSGVTSVEYGRLLHLRIRSQNTVVVNLPRVVSQDSDLTLVITYAGAVPNQELDVDTDRARTGRAGTEPLQANHGIPHLLLSNRAYLVSAESRSGLRDGFDAHLRSTGLFVRRERAARSRQRHRLASRHSRAGRKVVLSSHSAPISRLRYLALVVSRFARIGESKVAIENQSDPGSGVDSIAVSVVAQSSLRAQARSVPHADRRASCGSIRR